MRPRRLRMSESEKQRTYQAVLKAIQITKQRRDALEAYRAEAFSKIANNPGNYSFSFKIDFMKVTYKLITGHVQSSIANKRLRSSMVSSESRRIAEETGATYEEVNGYFTILMVKYLLF
jgi:hypothetical protein